MLGCNNSIGFNFESIMSKSITFRNCEPPCSFKFVVRQIMLQISNSLQGRRHFCFDANPYAIGRRDLRRNRNVWAAASSSLSHWQLESTPNRPPSLWMFAPPKIGVSGQQKNLIKPFRIGPQSIKSRHGGIGCGDNANQIVPNSLVQIGFV
jgi:hypothetical protein